MGDGVPFLFLGGSSCATMVKAPSSSSSSSSEPELLFFSSSTAFTTLISGLFLLDFAFGLWPERGKSFHDQSILLHQNKTLSKYSLPLYAWIPGACALHPNTPKVLIDSVHLLLWAKAEWQQCTFSPAFFFNRHVTGEPTCAGPTFAGRRGGAPAAPLPLDTTPSLFPFAGILGWGGEVQLPLLLGSFVYLGGSTLLQLGSLTTAIREKIILSNF